MRIVRLGEYLLKCLFFCLVIKSAFLTEAKTGKNVTDTIIKSLNNGGFNEPLSAKSLKRGTGDVLKKPLNRSDKDLSINNCPRILRSKSCYGYARRWIRFYLQIGGWGMLSVIAVGCIVLISTHILSTRSSNCRRNEYRQRISAMEQTTKKKLINV